MSEWEEHIFYHILHFFFNLLKVDLDRIKYEYKNMCKRSLYDDLAKELRGDFEEIVLNLVGKD